VPSAAQKYHAIMAIHRRLRRNFLVCVPIGLGVGQKLNPV
jgi:hypothetical protein